MKSRSIRLPHDLLEAITVVEDKEHLDEAPAIRKLLWLGLETYLTGLYRDGRLTLREVGRRLGLGPAETLDVLAEHGVRGNLTASDVLRSMEDFL